MHVEDVHNYLVGNNRILVHNKSYNPKPVPDHQRWTKVPPAVPGDPPGLPVPPGRDNSTDGVVGGNAAGTYFSTPHQGTILSVFCDGSVQGNNLNIQGAVWNALWTINGND